jgi:hypothetical protein|uniref:Methyltransferase n=1 Tax=viral metagenome TaxID=1070528 RepID=A0A6C0IP11_9ZZZZ
MLQLVNNERTDKNTVHSYLPLYERLLQHKKETATNVLEVGMLKGGSIKLWQEYFVNATVHGVDILPYDQMWEDIQNNERIVLHTSNDAYNEVFFKDTFLDTGIKFDFMLDDGPHTLESMKQFITLYSQLLTDDGILIIEDVQDIAWLQILRNHTPEHLKSHIYTYDLRSTKDRYDDIVFTITKHF